MKTTTMPYTFQAKGPDGVVTVPNPQEAAYLQCSYLKSILRVTYELIVGDDGSYTVKSPHRFTITFRKA